MFDGLKFTHSCVDEGKQETTNKRKAKQNEKKKKATRTYTYKSMIEHLQKDCPVKLYICPNKCDTGKKVKEYTFEEVKKHIEDECPEMLMCCKLCHSDNRARKLGDSKHSARNCRSQLHNLLNTQEQQIKLKKEEINQLRSNRMLQQLLNDLESRQRRTFRA